MATITVRVTDEEKEIIQKYAEFINLDVSDLVRESILEKIDDDMDLAAIRKYEASQNNVRNYTLEEVVKDLSYEKELL